MTLKLFIFPFLESRGHSPQSISNNIHEYIQLITLKCIHLKN